MNIKRIFTVIATVMLAGCAGMNRSCSSWNASSFGADWIIVQYRADGDVMNCWKLRNESVTNEYSSDGIYWKDTKHAHLVHISGWYNRVQVTGGDYEGAGKLIGVEAAKCGSGKYPTEGSNVLLHDEKLEVFNI